MTTDTLADVSGAMEKRFKPEWITAIGTLVLIAFEADRKWSMFGHQAHWPEIAGVLVVLGLVAVSFLNLTRQKNSWVSSGSGSLPSE